MKRILSLLVVIVLVFGTTQNAAAQERGTLSIKGGVGYFSISDTIGSLVVGLGTAFGGEDSSSESFVTMLNPNVAVYFSVTDKTALGGSLSFGYSSARRVNNETGAVSRSVKALYPSLCFDVQTTYYTSGKFSIYGQYGVGAMLYIVDQTNEGTYSRDYTLAPTGQLYPIGLSYGGRISGFIEGGWGAKGFVNAGISINL